MNTICCEPATTILVADHDDNARGLVKAVLSLKGFDVLEAMTGEEAFALTIENRPALLLIELRLPMVSGIRVIRRVREFGLRQMPIIATSRNEPASYHHLALAAGCVAHLEKPVEPDQLDELLEKLLPAERSNLISALVH